MKIIDANIVLWYLLKDNIKQFNKAVSIIDNHVVLHTTEVITEIVYVFEKVYEVLKHQIGSVLIEFFQTKQKLCKIKKL